MCYYRDRSGKLKKTSHGTVMLVHRPEVNYQGQTSSVR
jgi:hypothetical protein